MKLLPMSKTKILYCGHYKTLSIHSSGTKLETAAPIDTIGKGNCFSPTDLLALSLGSCILTLMGIASVNLGIELLNTTATVEKMMSLAPPRRVAKFIILVESPIEVTLEQREKLEQAALTCPVKESLHPDIELKIHFQWGEQKKDFLAIQQ